MPAAVEAGVGLAMRRAPLGGGGGLGGHWGAQLQVSRRHQQPCLSMPCCVPQFPPCQYNGASCASAADLRSLYLSNSHNVA